MSLEKLSTLSFDPSPNNLATSLRRLITPVLAIMGISLIILALIINSIKSKQTITEIVPTEAEGNSFSQKLVKVDIEGAVQQPGIYEIPNDSRIQDVLITAGGMVAKADRIYVSKNINLAQRVFDGQKIFIPEVSDLSNLSVLSNLIDLNKASESELDTLSGIGPVTAKKIISGRPYQNISELLSKHLVSQSVYDKIKDKVAVY